MIIHDFQQNSPEWIAARLGIPTASEFHRVITPEGEKSKQATGYAHILIAERLAGQSIETFEGTPWMKRGNELEQQAIDYYEFMEDAVTLPVGFITDDARTMGASPDRLIGEDGLLEIKCPAPHTLVGYLLEKNPERKYYPQIQGQLFITDRKWVDILFYHPTIPSLIIRVNRDEEYIKKLSEYLSEMRQGLTQRLEVLARKGIECKP